MESTLVQQNWTGKMGEKGILPSVDREVSTDDMMENRSYSNRRGAEKRWPREIERTKSVATEKVARSRKSTLTAVEKTAAYMKVKQRLTHAYRFWLYANRAEKDECAEHDAEYIRMTDREMSKVKFQPA